MRLPNFYWTKYIDNQYLCTVYQYNNIRYNAVDFIKHLNSKVPDIEHSKRMFYTTTSKKLNIDVSNEHIDAIKNLDVNRMKELICKKFDEKVPSNADISRVRGMEGKNW